MNKSKIINEKKKEPLKLPPIDNKEEKKKLLKPEVMDKRQMLIDKVRPPQIEISRMTTRKIDKLRVT